MTSVAIVGSGVSGLTAAHLLRRDHDVTLYESDERLGGHAHTHTLGPAHAPVRVDSGFIVHNDHTYPLLRKLFAELGVDVRPTEMSMSIHDQVSGVQYAGGRGWRGIFAQPRRICDRRFLGMLLEVRRFHRAAAGHLSDAADDDLTTYGEFLSQRGFSDYFIGMFAIPLVSCVWSTGATWSLDYPARHLFAFLDNHGMLTVKGSRRWYTVCGGSGTYVERIVVALEDVVLGATVTRIERGAEGVRITATGVPDRVFSHVVIATHADQALGVLADASEAEKEVLGAFGYTANETVLHTDGSLMPRARAARASWNHLTPAASPDVGGHNLADRDSPPVVTYWMNRLQGLPGPEQYYVTLNGRDRIAPESIIAVMDYTHPIYTPEAVAAQRRLPELSTSQTAYAGAYHGWGFHEDGCRAGVAAAEHFGVRW